MKMKIDWKHFIKTRVVSEEMKDVKFFTEVINAFAKFTAGDWGITSEGDKALNDDALITGDRILASYPTSKGKIWINIAFNDVFLIAPDAKFALILGYIDFDNNRGDYNLD